MRTHLTLNLQMHLAPNRKLAAAPTASVQQATVDLVGLLRARGSAARFDAPALTKSCFQIHSAALLKEQPTVPRLTEPSPHLVEPPTVDCK